ncbi:MAG: response regulator transcription factor [Pseudomonadota bacterium]|nr:MAG: response regulator transcription factor [Pseudomonadota bacterium]
MTETGGQATVVVVDDDQGVRESLALLLGTAGFRVCCHDSGEKLLAAGPPEGAACILLDLRMPGASGIEVQKRLRAEGWRVPVMFLTGHADVPVAVEALKNGAIDFFEKTDFSADQLIVRINRAVEDHRIELAQQAEARDLAARIAELSDRELEVARLAAGGMANKVIGLELGISERTVEVHRGRAMRKLGLRSMAELIRIEPALHGRARN